MAEDRKTYTIKEGVSVVDEVVATIIGLAATEVEGVTALAGNLAHDAISKAGAGRLAKGVRVAQNEEGELAIRLAIHIAFGVSIPAICAQVQERVKNAVETMTGLTVSAVDIKIAAVNLDEA